MASKTGKLFLTGAVTAALGAGCQTQPLTTTPSLGVDATAQSAEYDLLAKKAAAAKPGQGGGAAQKNALPATTCDEARYTVFARSSTEILHFTGSKNVVTGDVHTNDGVHMAGNNDKITNITEAVDAISIKGKNNSAGTQVKASVEPYPFVLDPASFGTPTFDFPGDVNLNDRPEVWKSKGVLKDGVYRAGGTIILPKNAASGCVTFVAKSVQLPGKSHKFIPYSQGVLIYASGTGNNVVHLSGSSNSYAGLILVPNGTFQFTGNSNVLNGQVYTDAFKISGANNRITYSQYIDCPVTVSPAPSPTPSHCECPVATPTPTPETTPSPVPTATPTGEPIPAPTGTEGVPESTAPSASATPVPTPTPTGGPRQR